MENLQQKWTSCLSMIKEHVNNKRMFETWFADIRLEKYDAEKNTIVLRVPSNYVYEYLEQHCLKLLEWALAASFKPGVQLSYRIRKETSFADVADYLRQRGYDQHHNNNHIRIDNARKRLEDGLHYFLKGREKWLPAYDKVVDWLTDNRGRGLLCVGTTGMGKSLICQQIIPVILANASRPVPTVNAGELHGRVEELKKERIVVIDDLGKEPRKHFGNIDNSFFELCDNAERTGNILVITTNLSTTPINPSRPAARLYSDSIQNRYGNEVLDRLLAITAFARFEGESMREKK